MTIPAAIRVLRAHTADLHSVGHFHLIGDIRDLHSAPTEDKAAALADVLQGHSLGRVREPGLEAFVLAVCQQVIAEARTALAFAAL
jgi:hypothetical protein